MKTRSDQFPGPFKKSLGIIALSFMLSACGDNNYKPMSPDDTSQKASGVEFIKEHGTNCEDAECFSQTFTQEGSSTTQALDLLIVTDTSGSLNDERGKVADNIDLFISMIPSSADVNIGVMLAHGNTSSRSGQLYQKSTEPVVLSTADPTLTNAELRTILRDKLTNGLPGDSDTDGGEAGLTSLINGLNTINLPASQAAGMFRENAALAVIFVADENDICTPGSVNDPDGKEGPAFVLNCEGILPIGVYNRLKLLKGDNPLIVSAIVYTGEAPVPSRGENEIGLGYLDVVSSAGEFGVAVDLASENIAEALEQIGELSGQAMDLQMEFPLTETEDINPESIVVEVDGEIVQYSFDEATNTVQLEYAGDFGSEISVSYCENDNTPDPGDDCNCGIDELIPMCVLKHDRLKQAQTVYVEWHEVVDYLNDGALLGKCKSYKWIKRWKKNKRRYNHHH